MNEEPYLAREVAGARGAAAGAVRGRSVAAVFGWVMGLVAISIGFLALGAWVGRDISPRAGLAWSLVGFGMLMVMSFAGRTFRVGRFAMGWLFATAAVIGVGLGPTIAYFTVVDRTGVIQAAAGTACTVVAMGAAGMLMARDLARWMRPLSIAILVSFGGIMAWTLFAGALNPIVSLFIYGMSALMLLVDFNYLRKHGTEDDAIMLATGIFVSIVNVFLSLLSILNGR